MIPVDLSANCDVWIYDPNGSANQILGIRSRDPFSGSTDMSVNRYRVSGKKDTHHFVSFFKARALIFSKLAIIVD